MQRGGFLILDTVVLVLEHNSNVDVVLSRIVQGSVWVCCPSYGPECPVVSLAWVLMQPERHRACSRDQSHAGPDRGRSHDSRGDKCDAIPALLTSNQHLGQLLPPLREAALLAWRTRRKIVLVQDGSGTASLPVSHQSLGPRLP